MALATNTEFTITATATTGNVNGAGFNASNSNMLTDLACDTNTGNTASPVVSSASYNFVAGDVGNWVYVKSGTNWISGWYKIASVASNKATLNGTIGQAQVYSLGLKAPSTVVGCATVGTPTGGTFTIDYSQADTAIATATDLTCTAASTTVVSASAAFTPVMVGNYMHPTALTGTGALVGWYEIVSYTNATTLVLDRTPTNGVNNITAGTYYVGGAGRWNGLEDALWESLPAGAKVWTKVGTYNLSAAISLTAAGGTAANPIMWMAYTTIPGDFVIGSTRPVINFGAAAGFTPQVYTLTYNMDFTGTGTTVVAGSQTSALFFFCRATNTSTTANRAAWSTTSYLYFCEGVCQNGYAFSHSGSSAAIRVHGCYFHDSVYGMFLNSTSSKISKTVFANCRTAAIRNAATTASTVYSIEECTFYGRSSTPTGIGIEITDSAVGNYFFFNNIFSGLATGISCAAANLSITGMNNCFYNNTTDVTNYTKSSTDDALNPQFTDIAEIAISNGTMTGGTAVLTSSGADFSSVEDNVDYFYLISQSGGTGTFVGMYLITSHTTTTLTFNNNAGTSGSATSIVGYVMTGHNFSIGTNLKALAAYTVGAATSYLDIGGVQRQETSGSSTTVGWASQS